MYIKDVADQVGESREEKNAMQNILEQEQSERVKAEEERDAVKEELQQVVLVVVYLHC